jgi:hypothetical protein
MPTCALLNCENSDKKGKRLFKLPKNGELAQKWVKFMSENGVKKINENSRLCEDHFHIDKNGNRSNYPRYAVQKVEVCIINEFCK